ncbi:MAG: hypothetical protein ACYDEP_01725 [Acidimicrobiales bacterium]
MTNIATIRPPLGKSYWLPDGFPSTNTLAIAPWEDPDVERFGIDPRSLYTETFWLPVLGPSATWLLRRVAHHFDSDTHGFELNLEETALEIGLGGIESRHAPLHRAFARCVRFGVARDKGERRVEFRRSLAPIPLRQLARLPVSLQELHRGWFLDSESPATLPAIRRRSRLLALDLVALGDDLQRVERKLLSWGIHPALSFESASWAVARHTEVTQVVAAQPSSDGSP